LDLAHARHPSPETPTLSLPDALPISNDSDVDGDTLSAVLVSQPAHGTLTFNSNGSFSYTPAANYNGIDSFTYKANDGQADSGIAIGTIHISSPDDAPAAINDTHTTAD